VTLSVAADWRVAAFIGVTAVLTVLVFGCVPAFRVSFVDGAAALRQTSRRVTIDGSRARFQRVLVAAQMAISMVLVVAALMFVQTFRKLTGVDLGFASKDTFALAFSDPSARNLMPDAKAAFQPLLTDAIRTAPGVVDAAATTTVPLSGDKWSHFFRVQGAAHDEQKASRFSYVSPEYFHTLVIPLRAGRLLTAADDRRARRVVVVNESFVRTHLDGRNPIGTVIRRMTEPGYPEESFEIVGVVGDTKYETLRNEDCLCDAGVAPRPPIVYVPIAQMPSLYPWPPVIVRSDGRPALAASIAGSVRRLNPAITFRLFPLQSAVDQALAADRMTAWLAGGFGVLALVLVMAGLYGLIAYLTAGRTNEIGIRLSLGSTRSQIVGLVVRDSVWPIVIGVAAGVPLALGAMDAAKALLFGLSPADLPTVVAALAGLAAAAALAGAIPAWRASRLDPNVVLRAE